MNPALAWYSAQCLQDGGWTADDLEEMMEYGLSMEDAEQICDCLARLEGDD